MLGAGAARGWAHIGALQELDALGLRPDVVVGSSIGSLVGGCYAAGRLEMLEAFARSLTRRRVFGLLDFSFTGSGLIGGERLRAQARGGARRASIEDLPIRFAGVATEIGDGHEIWLRRGALVDAIRASYALPGVFEPVKIDGRWLFDGAIVNPVPVSVARALGAERVIALNISSDSVGRGTAIQDPFGRSEPPAAADEPAGDSSGMIARWWRGGNVWSRADANADASAPGLLTSMVNAFDILQDRIMRSRLAGDPPDALVQLKVGKIGMFEFHRADELIALGREAVRKAGRRNHAAGRAGADRRRRGLTPRRPAPSGGRDIFAQRLALAVEGVDVALDDVADGNDADQASVLYDRDMAKPALRHRLHDMLDRVVASHGDDLRRHVTRNRIIERGRAMPGDDADHVALGKNAQDAQRSVRDDHRSHAFRGEELYDFLQGAMRLGGENIAPLVVENARNCHPSLPFSGGLVVGPPRAGKMRRQLGAIKSILKGKFNASPPSTRKHCLVIIALSSAARNSARRATSSASSERSRH